MIIKLISAKPNPRGVERYARYLARYMADGDRRWLAPDAVEMDYGLTLSTYMARGSNMPDEARDRVLFHSALVGGEPCDWAFGNAEVERRLELRSRKVKKPVRHAVLSCRAGEELTEQGCVDAVRTLGEELACEDAAILWAAHGDTNNFHLHIMFATIDPVTGGALPFGRSANGSAAWKEAMQRAIARIEHDQKLQPEGGSRYRVDGDEVVRTTASKPDIRKRAPLRQEVLDWEARSGFTSFTRVAQDVAGPILDGGTGWADLHAALAPHGIGIRPAGNGGELYAGDDHVKLSNVDRQHSWRKLTARLGPYEPPVGVSLAPYRPRFLDADKAAKWLRRRNQERAVSDCIDRRVAALLAARDAALAEANARLSEHRADLAGFDGDPRLHRELSSAWPALRASATSAIRAAFAGRIDAVRALRNAAAASDNLEFVDLDALGALDVGIAMSWHADRRSPSELGLAGFDSERIGDVVRYWSQDDLARRGQPALVDAGAIIWVNDRSDRSVEPALTLAEARFGEVAVFGDTAYLRQCARVAERLGMPIETITVAEARRRARLSPPARQVSRQNAINAHLRMADEGKTRRQAWARAYRRATPIGDYAVQRGNASALQVVPHHSDIATNLEYVIDAPLSDPTTIQIPAPPLGSEIG